MRKIRVLTEAGDGGREGDERVRPVYGLLLRGQKK